MLRDADVRVVLGEGRFGPALPAPRPPFVPLDVEADAGLPAPTAPRVAPANAAYVLFTSGSTGEPKGTVVEHRAIVTRALDSAGSQGLAPGDRALCFLPLTFDAALDELLPALLRGATVVLHPDPRGDTARDLLERCARHGVTHLHVPVGMLHELAEELARVDVVMPGTLRRIVTGGESPAAWRVAAILRQGGVVVTNAYGPTEAVVAATREDFASAEEVEDPLPMGRPVRGTAVHVVGAGGKPVPIGAIGEVWIGGVLARAYARRPAETAAAFVPDPFSGVPGARLYRTGDFARRLADGRLVFVGRRDTQVKLRGFRVELPEVEATLARVAGVRDAVAAVRGEGADRQLVAWVVPAEGARLDAGEVRGALRERLPEMMVPGAVVVLDALPRTPSGKVDRRAFPAPHRAAHAAVRTAPRDDVERALAPLWCEALGLAAPDVEESFFEAGGNSLLAIRFVTAVRRALGRNVPVAALFRAPTLEAFARLLREAGPPEAADGVRTLVRLRAGADLPPLVCLPSAFGGVSDFAQLAAAVDARRAVFALPALDAPDAVEAADLVEGDAAAAAAAIGRAVREGPVHLLGWSYGGLVAFETARRLRESGRDVGALVLLDVPAPGARRERSGASPLDALDVAPPAGAQAADVERWRAGVARRIEAARAYRPRPWSGDALLVRGTESLAGDSHDPALGWSRLVEGDLAVEWVPGSHDSILGGEGARAVAALVERHASPTTRVSRP
jgi:amino acid adenylation domain-containing protein